MLFTGDVIDGRTAQSWGLAHEAVPAAELDGAVRRLAERIAAVPKNQLMMQKLMINQPTRTWPAQHADAGQPVRRHRAAFPEGMWFKGYAERYGFAAAAEWRDSGRPIPEPMPGADLDPLMPPLEAGARSRWSSKDGGDV